ncbi:MAG: ATP-binding protein [Candidatus Cryptobacteroides sp.]
MNRGNIIGRKRELDILERLYKSDKSEFLAIYGRRRVGKSYLIDETFRDELAFSIVGTFKKDEGPDAQRLHKKTQLKHFYKSLVDYGLNPALKEPDDWMEAFDLLKKLLDSDEGRKVVFIDELPWLAGPQSSELIEELGYFWNSWAVRKRNIFLIVCGSATSWMLDNVINDYGGLHSRLTEKIYLAPFDLNECRIYYRKRGFLMSDYEIALCYMAIGGIPYYMDRLRSDQTLSQNINDFYFRNDSIDREFRDVYTGLFQSADRYIDIVRALGRKFYGMTRNELLESTGIKGGGTFTKTMDNLQECGIVRSFSRYGKQRKEVVYQLCDFFTLFYLNFAGMKGAKTGWNSFQRSHEFESWAGRTFELLCSRHIRQIKDALRIKSSGKDFCWSGPKPDGGNVQIDMVIPSPEERTDYVCEMKFSENKYHITSDYEKKLLDKVDAFRISKSHKDSHSLLLVMITSMGLGESMHNRAVNATVCLEDLFRE